MSTNSFFQMISLGVICISLLTNTFLIILILHRSSCGLCGYRWLLLTFALGNISISLYNAVVEPKYIQIENGYVFFTLAALNKPPHIGFVINTVYSILFHQPFNMLMLHFIYRYVRLNKPKILEKRRWGFPTFANAVNLILSSNIFYSNVLLRQSQELCFGSEFTPPNIIMINFANSASRGGGLNWLTIRAISHSGFSIFLSLFVIIVCTIRIIFDTKLSKLSMRTHKLQVQLIHSLILQCLVAFLFIFLPYIIMVFSPLMGIRFYAYGNMYSLIASSTSTLDAILTILTMKKFRALTYSWMSPLSPRSQIRKVSATVGNMFITFRVKNSF